MEITTRKNTEQYIEFVIADGNAKIESGLLDYREALQAADELARAALTLREHATDWLVLQQRKRTEA